MDPVTERICQNAHGNPNFQMGYVSAVDAARKYLLKIPSKDSKGNDPGDQYSFTALDKKRREEGKSLDDIIGEYKSIGMTCAAGVFLAYYLGSDTVRNYLLEQGIDKSRVSLFNFFKYPKDDKRELIDSKNWELADRGDIFFDGFKDPWKSNRGHTGILLERPRLENNKLVLKVYAAYSNGKFGEDTIKFTKDARNRWTRPKLETLEDGTKEPNTRCLLGFGRLFELRIRGKNELREYNVAKRGIYAYSIGIEAGSSMEPKSIQSLNLCNPDATHRGEGGKVYLFKEANQRSLVEGFTSGKKNTGGFKSHHGGADVELQVSRQDGRTPIQFNITTEIYIYSDDPNVLAAPGGLVQIANNIQTQINQFWNNFNGPNFTAVDRQSTHQLLPIPAVFNVTVRVLNNTSQALIDRMMSDGLREKVNRVFVHINNSPNDGRQTLLNSWSQGNMGSWSMNGRRGSYAHEFGHLCGYWRWSRDTGFPMSSVGNHSTDPNSIMAAQPNFAQRAVTQADVDGLNFSFGLGHTGYFESVSFGRKGPFPMDEMIVDRNADLYQSKDRKKTIGLRQKAIFMTMNNYFIVPNNLPLY